MQSTTQTIPLFPLDVVLFPGMVLPLHIFEPRYRKMVRDCLVSGEPFGMVWAESEPLLLAPDRPLIGTKAMLSEVVPLPDGRFNISAIGGERFLVRSLSQSEPYLVGQIEPYPLVGGDSQEAQKYLPALLQLFQQYLGLMSRATEQEIVIDPLPDDPMTLAFVVAVLYQTHNWRKQQLLSIETIPEMMKYEIELLRLENVLIAQALELQEMGTMAPLVGGSLAVYSLN